MLTQIRESTKKLHPHHPKHVGIKVIKASIWFSLGAILGLFFFTSFLYIGYKQWYSDRVYLGVTVDGINFSGKTQEEVRHYFAQKNKILQQSSVTLHYADTTATIAAKQIGFGYDENLLAEQAVDIGKSGTTLSDMSIITQAYMDGIRLPGTFHYDDKKLQKLLLPLQKKLDKRPIDPLFTVTNDKVVTFRLATNGQAVDVAKIKEILFEKFKETARDNTSSQITMPVPITVVTPAIADQATDLGIKELIAQGSSLFQGSIENRIFNIGLAASRLNGIVIKPEEVFSFNEHVGDISKLSGFRQAYVIENGKTVLGDGGGVCQVSTTLFRAALKAGLPIIERNQHAYRVGYYEQDAGPGVDAAIYSPTVDLKFKNNTGYHILIQTYFDPTVQSLTFSLYGTDDGREVIVNDPIILSQSPAPEPRYQDDPNLPKDQIRQVDFAAPGAKVAFTRVVKKDDKIILSDKFASNYRPWQAVYLRGTKE
ncbi:MAG: VanW family protein [Patescibacteria group bacterium]